MRNKNKNIGKWIINAIIVIAVVVLFATVALTSVLNGVLKSDSSQEERIPPEEETFEADEPEENMDEPSEVSEEEETSPDLIMWPDVDADVMKNVDTRNILLIGQDTRVRGERARSDTMIVCNINKKTGEIKLISFMRDLYVPIPGYSDNRLNAAYAFGGMSLLDETLEKNFGVHVDGNVEVDFDGFIQSMSVIGNLDIELNEEEADYLNKHGTFSDQPSTGNSNTKGYFTAGVNTLTPEELLSYSRIRYVGNNDYERTERQRKVLKAAFAKVKTLDIRTQLEFANAILPNLTTDLSKGDLLGYVYTVASNGMGIGDTYRIPVDGCFYGASIRGMSVLVPDLEKNRAALKEILEEAK